MHYQVQKESKTGLNKLYISQGAWPFCFNFTIFQDHIKFYWGLSGGSVLSPFWKVHEKKRETDKVETEDNEEG